MNRYTTALEGLNNAQKQAVLTTEGPVLVIAGPGTGKTQLLGVRVAHILKTTDTLPQNILCLTFTENGAENMRERLTRFIGKEAYNVTISTYHAFGGDLIKRFPEVFNETHLQTPVDELAKRQLVREIIASLSYQNPLKQLRHHTGDLIGTISEIKRALLTSDDLRAISKENAAFIAQASSEIQHIFSGMTAMPRTLSKALPVFESLLEVIQKATPSKPIHHTFGSLAGIAANSLATAIIEANEAEKTNPLTKWKNTWLAKDADNAFIFDGSLQNQRILALADVFEAYQDALRVHEWYDFDDMILRAIEALEKNPDLKYTLQERYLYIMLDEFQDTNAAQLKLVQLLSDNPVNEGRPNILAVGDDDQAIYAFQGAQYSNMLDFYRMYRDVTVINLTENYRSSKDILTTAENVALQIEARLERHFENMSKKLSAANPKLPERADISRVEFLSDVAQYDWIAHEIKKLIDQGTQPSEIAILAPKHRQLEPLVPYLAELGIPMRYEKRENILEAPVVSQLVIMSKLVLALHARNYDTADALWPEVLSYDFWNIPIKDIWKLAWEIDDAPGNEQVHWSKKLLASDIPAMQLPALLFLSLAPRVDTESCEQMLDFLIGTDAITTHQSHQDIVRSPLRSHYTNRELGRTNPELFYETISHLTVLRTKLREYEATREQTLKLGDLITFVEMYENAEERLLNTSPYNQQADAVRLMTVFKAKGLEFEHVFLPSCQDEVWGASSRGNSNKLTLPVNLEPIRHAGATNDERLRILFVAITRAKIGLHLTSFSRTYSGKNTKRLSFFDEQEQTDGSFKSIILPEHIQDVVASDHEAPTLESLELHWRHKHTTARGNTELRSLLEDRLQSYQLSPTHLTTFIDLEYGGPEQFFFKTLLRFPEAPTIDSQYGNAIHASLEWAQKSTDRLGSIPSLDEISTHFTTKLRGYKLSPEQYEIQKDRGEKALAAFMATRGHIFKPGDKAELSFKREGVFVDDVHMAGKVDRIEVDRKNKTITVVDYKTGKSHAKWGSEARLHKYKLQLYCYKLLIEGSMSFRGYHVTQGRIEFIEPDMNGRIHHLELDFTDTELMQVKQLLRATWNHVLQLTFPDVTGYDTSLSGILQFEKDLISGDI